MITKEGQKKVVIVGGGFAGIEAAKKLLKNKDVSVTLITKNPYFEYYPALYRLVTGALAIEVCVPYKEIFKNKTINIQEGVYTKHYKDTKEVELSDGKKIPYDYLILAMGSQTNYFDIPGIKENAFPFKSAQEALRLKQHFCELFEASKDIPKDLLVERFHVTVIGGGPSGVELAGDITTFLRRKCRLYHVDPSFVTVDLIEANGRVLGSFPEKVSKKAEARLRKLRVNLYTNRTIKTQDMDSVSASGIRFDSDTVIWTAGVKISDEFLSLPLTDRKKVLVESDFSIKDHPGVFVVGDGAGAPGTGLAQGAISHSRYVAEKIIAEVRGKTGGQYKPKKTGHIIPIGHYWAVLSFGGFTMSGFFPWVLRNIVDFKYFTTIVSPFYVLKVFLQGAKYRRGEYE